MKHFLGLGFLALANAEILNPFNWTVTLDDGSTRVEEGNCDNDNDIHAAMCGHALTVPGCTETTACNYDPLATEDDGTCILRDALGVCGGDCQEDENKNGVCDDDDPGCNKEEFMEYESNSLNYDACRRVDCTKTNETGCASWWLAGNSLTFIAHAENVCNDNPNGFGGIRYRTWCPPPEVSGCTDDTACNHDPSATVDDGSCILRDALGVCGGDCQEDENKNGVCDDDDPGCNKEEFMEYESNSLNYDACRRVDCTKTNETGCASWWLAGNSLTFIAHAENVCNDNPNGFGGIRYRTWCPPPEVSGCTDPAACNYDASATVNDGSCVSAIGCDRCSGGTVETITDADNDSVCDDVDPCIGICTGQPVQVQHNGTTYEACEGTYVEVIKNGNHNIWEVKEGVGEAVIEPLSTVTVKTSLLWAQPGETREFYCSRHTGAKFYITCPAEQNQDSEEEAPATPSTCPTDEAVRNSLSAAEFIDAQCCQC